MAKERIIHSFDRTDPEHECYGKHSSRTALCGIDIAKEFVTNVSKNITCKKCLKFQIDLDSERLRIMRNKLSNN